MAGYDVKACDFCGRLFQSFGRTVCPECSGKLDEDFIKVRAYLYEGNDSRNVAEIAEKTGVSEKSVLYLMKDGRLSAKHASTGGGSSLKCAICGAPIASGKLCPRCLAAWRTEVVASDKKEAGEHGVEHAAPHSVERGGSAKTVRKMHMLHRWSDNRDD